MARKQEQISMFGILRPTGADRTAGSRSSAIAVLADQIGGLAFQEGAKQRVKEGKTAGALAVKRDEEGNIISPEEKSDFTLFGQAFNESARLAHRAQIGIDTKETLDRLQNEHKLDPQAFKIASEGALKGIKKNLSEEMAAIVGLDFDSSVSSRHSQLNKQLFARETEKQKADFLSGVESARDDLLNASRSGDKTRAIDITVENDAAINQAIESGLITEGEANKIKKEASESALYHAELGGIEAALTDKPTPATIETATQALKTIEKKTYKILDADQKLQVEASAKSLIASAVSTLTRSKNKNKALLNGQIKGVNADIVRAKKNLNLGIKINESELNSVVDRAININNQTGEQTINVAELQNEINEAREVNTFSLQSGDIRERQEQTLIERERAGQLTIEGGEVLGRIRAANKKVNQQIESKGIGFYQEQGLTNLKPLKLLDEEGFFDQDAFIKDLSERKEVTNEATEHYKRDISPLTNEEAVQFTRGYDALDSSQKVSMLSLFVDGFGDQSIPALSQINEKGAPIMALSGAILNDGGDPRLIILGQDLLKEPSNRGIMPNVAELDAEISTALGTAYALNPQQRGATVGAIKSAYAALAIQGGTSPVMVDSELLERSVNIVSGGVFEHNDSKLTAPTRGMDSDDFEDLMDNLKPEIFNSQDQELAGNLDRALLIEQIQDNATLHDVGPGEYLVKIGGSFLVDKNGDGFILNLRGAADE